jgi:hypothetical protein
VVRRLKCQHHERKIARRTKQKLTSEINVSFVESTQQHDYERFIGELAWCCPLPSCRTMKMYVKLTSLRKV